MRTGALRLLVALAATLVLAAPAARAQGTLSALETDVDVILATTRPSVVTVVNVRDLDAHKPGAAARVGSGVAVSENEILTTASVVEGARQIWVRTSNRLQLRAVLVGADPIANIALLRIPGVELPPLRFATSRPVRVGDWVIAVGTARDVHDRSAHSLGTVLFRHRDPRLPLWQLSNAVYPGLGGAAVVSARGELVGLLQGELDPASDGAGAADGAAANASFMLGADDLRNEYLQLRRDGRVRYGWLGVTTRAVSVASESEAGATVPLGVEVLEVAANGPAARAGLRRRDLIVAFEGVPVEDPMQLARWVTASPPGSAVRMVWVRDDLRRDGRPVLAESPAAVPQWATSVPVAAVVPGGAPSGTRIADLERRIERMNRELQRLRSSSADGR